MKLPPQLKPLTPFVRRAAELDRAVGERERMMSYFCRSYAMELGIKLNDNSDAVKVILLGLMEQLEKDKATLPSYDGKDEAKQFVEGFALEVFKKADDKDRAGLADKGTARTFYAADTFFQTLKQFGDLEPDLKETSLYAKWKATDILKALKEGRKPTPGPPGGVDDEEGGADDSSNGGASGGGGGGMMASANSNASAALYDIPAAPTGNTPPPVDPDAEMAARLAAQLADAGSSNTTPSHTPPPPSYNSTIPPTNNNAPPPAFAAAPAPAPAPAESASIFSKIGGFLGGGSKKQPHLSDDEQHDALEWSKYAVRAIETEQYARAAECLQRALHMLHADPNTRQNQRLKY